MSELKAITVYDAYWKANSVGEGTGILIYLKYEADKVIAELKESHKKEVEQLLMEIEEIVKGAISMFRLSDNCRGLDLKSPLGRVANTAFKHWCFVESIQNKNKQLQEDKERLLHNNHHLLDEVERLKEDVADARQKACEFQEIINEKEAQLNHANYKRCLAMADMCSEALCYWDNVKYTFFKGEAYCFRKMNHYGKWGQIWLAIAEKFKEA